MGPLVPTTFQRRNCGGLAETYGNQYFLPSDPIIHVRDRGNQKKRFLLEFSCSYSCIHISPSVLSRSFAAFNV
jgi:hypothetical protein